MTSYMSIHDHAFDDTKTNPEEKLAAIQRVFDQSPELVSSSSDQALVKAIAFARANHRSRSLWISREATDPDTGQTITMDDLSWIPDKWWYLVTGQKRRQKVPERIDRHQFEICLFSELVNELKCADMCIVGSEDFSDPTDQLVSMEELWKKLPKYAEVVGLW